jgi:hypothetical protein
MREQGSGSVCMRRADMTAALATLVVLLLAMPVQASDGVFPALTAAAKTRLRRRGPGEGQISQSTGVTTADFNGDGLIDVAVSIQAAPGRVAVLLNRGHRRFKRRRNFIFGQGLEGLTVGRFNHDRGPDLAVTDAGSGTVRVLLNRP